MSAVRNWAKSIKREIVTVNLIARDPQTPRIIKAAALITAAYAFSPIDLIPDCIPVLGYLDDIILLPLAVLIILKCTPKEIVSRCRAQAESIAEKPVSKKAAAVIILIWLTLAGALIWAALRLF